MAPLYDAHGLPAKKSNLADVIVGIWLWDLDVTSNLSCCVLFSIGSEACHNFSTTYPPNLKLILRNLWRTCLMGVANLDSVSSSKRPGHSSPRALCDDSCNKFLVPAH